MLSRLALFVCCKLIARISFNFVVALASHRALGLRGFAFVRLPMAREVLNTRTASTK